MNTQLLKMNNIHKSFLGNEVLKGVDFELNSGEVISIIGTNGAGKSTLSNIIAGVHPLDKGEIFVDGVKVNLRNPKDAERFGIGMVHQEPTLCENMKVYENIFLNREIIKNGIFLDREEMRKQSLGILDYLGFTIDIEQLAQDLSLVAKGVVSIAKAMLMQPKILILDEVTAPLSQKEVEHLFGVIDNLSKKGLGIIYISHKIKEIVQISDKVVVLKDGENVGDFSKANDAINERSIIQLMLGESEGWQQEYSKKDLAHSKEEVLLQICDLEKKDLYENINIDLHKGEIVGLVGLKGSGITELMFTLFGAIAHDCGSVFKNSKEIRSKNPKEAVANGICMITNDRQREGLALMLSVEENIVVSNLGHIRTKVNTVDKKECRRIAEKYIDALSIVTTGPNQPVQYLSGGNQQKVVISKWLLCNTDVILIDEPTRGIDVKAKNEIYNLLIEQKSQGKGIIVFSPEIPELLNFCDRILIMERGKIVGEIGREDKLFTEKGFLAVMHAY